MNFKSLFENLSEQEQIEAMYMMLRKTHETETRIFLDKRNFYPSQYIGNLDLIRQYNIYLIISATILFGLTRIRLQ